MGYTVASRRWVRREGCGGVYARARKSKTGGCRQRDDAGADASPPFRGEGWRRRSNGGERERESGVSRAAAAVGQRTRTRIHTHRCGPSSCRFLEAGPDVARETENADLRLPRLPRSSSELVDSRFGRGLTSRRSRGAPYASARSLGWRLRAVVTEEGEK